MISKSRNTKVLSVLILIEEELVRMKDEPPRIASIKRSRGGPGSQAGGFSTAVSLRVDDVHHLDLGEAEQTPRTVLHADSRPLRSAEWQIRRDREMLIHPGRAAFELRGNFRAAIRILGPDRSAESVM